MIVAERARARAEELRLALRRAAALGAVAYIALLPLDLYLADALFHAADLGWCVALRLTGSAALATPLAIRREGWTERGLIAFTSTMVPLSVAGLALLALEFGGLVSFYVLMLAFYGIALGTFMPSHWTRMTVMLVPGLVTYYAVLLAGVLGSPALAPQLRDAGAVATFVGQAVLVVGLAIFAIAGGHAHWRARTRLQDARRLGRYQLRVLLGRGGMNEVWRAFDTRLGREVALKLLRSHHADDATSARFVREALATSALTSPHTIRLHDFGANEDGTAWIVMELLEGRDLAELVEAHGPLDPRRVVHFARQAADSLAEAHAHGIVHRDIKPANLFALSTAGQEDMLKLLDFGIARRLDASDWSATLVGTVVGTPAFMAPEQIAGASASPASDIFAFGATLYALLAGRLPFAESEHLGARPSTPHQPLAAAVPHPLAPGLEDLVTRCLAPDPRDRPADGAALVHALQALALPPWTSDEARAWWAATASSQRE